MSKASYLVELIGDTTWNEKQSVNDWLNDRAAEGWELITVDSGAGYFVRKNQGPENVTVPHVSQSGATLNCTMGEWTHDPTSYVYQWYLDGAAVTGTDDTSPDYTVQSADLGKAATCVVTASNAYGTGEAPASNSIIVT
jgi:hypothetical protein